MLFLEGGGGGASFRRLVNSMIFIVKPDLLLLLFLSILISELIPVKDKNDQNYKIKKTHTIRAFIELKQFT